ncbi:MAG: amidohydrolase [Firmicutes bacterium]|nr:amidohydrolase [Bacillota bacterium]
MSKTAFFNAKVYVEKGVYAEAVLQEDGWIKAVGTTGEILTLAGYDAEKIDCGGKTIVPGFNDSHMHICQVGFAMQQLDLSKCKSVEDMIEAGRKYIADNPGIQGVFTQSWNDDLFDPDKKRLPDKHDCDAISTEIPVFLGRICGHSAAVNSLILEKMGLDKDHHTIEGGEVVLGEDGEPNGYLFEAAQADARLAVPGWTAEDAKKFFKMAMEYGVSHGMTTTQSNDYTTVAPKAIIKQALEEMYAAGEAPMRYVGQCGCENMKQLEEYIAEDWGRKVGLMEYGPVKMFKDGSLGARSAMMRNDYADDPKAKGVDRIADSEQMAMIQYAEDRGVQVVTHCIGDGAIDVTQKMIAKAAGTENKNRHSIIHYQITDMDMVKFTKEHNILVAYQPVFLEYDIHIVESRCGHDLAMQSYCFKTAHDMGIHASYGTDSPVEDCNPFLNLYCAVTRKDYNGFPEGGWNPKECMDVETAIDAYTYESAYAEFKEGVKGRIKPGFYADLVILDKDIFTCDPMEIKDILPVLTMVDGKIVYRK